MWPMPMSRQSLHLVLWSMLACVRVVAPASEPPRLLDLGAECASADACTSGACQDGVCCNRACEPDESCVVGARTGQCTPRPLGFGCERGGQCPSGFCADGVCCSAACTGNCESCAVPNQEGSCQVVPDNTDPRNVCGGPCQACFAGACAPALLGTNPKGNVETAGCGAGEACNALGTCASALEEACTSPDGSTCASGVCMADVCSLGLWEGGAQPGANPQAHRLAILAAVAKAVDGEPCLLLREDQDFPWPHRSGNDYDFRLRRRSVSMSCRTNQSWESTLIVDFPRADLLLGTGIPFSARFRHQLTLLDAPSGRIVVGLGFSDVVRDLLGTSGCGGVWAKWIHAGARVGGTRCLSGGLEHPDAPSGTAPTHWMDAQVSGAMHLRVVVAVAGDNVASRALYLDCPDASCLAPKPFHGDTLESFPGRLMVVDGEPVLFHLREDFATLAASRLDQSTQLDLAALGCSPAQTSVQLALSYDLDHPGTSVQAAVLGDGRLLVTLACGNEVLAVPYDAASHTFGTATMFAANGTLVASPLVLPGGRWGVTSSSRSGLFVHWLREDGSAQRDTLLAQNPNQGEVMRVVSLQQDSLPLYVLEMRQRVRYEVPETSPLETAERYECGLDFLRTGR